MLKIFKWWRESPISFKALLCLMSFLNMKKNKCIVKHLIWSCELKFHVVWEKFLAFKEAISDFAVPNLIFTWNFSKLNRYIDECAVWNYQWLYWNWKTGFKWEYLRILIEFHIYSLLCLNVLQLEHILFIFVMTLKFFNIEKIS